jgi:hypothetical protein
MAMQDSNARQRSNAIQVQALQMNGAVAPHCHPCFSRCPPQSFLKAVFGVLITLFGCSI